MLRFVTLILLICHGAVAQQIEISGFIRDSKTNKVIPFATVELMKEKLGVATDYQGKFQLQLQSDCLNDTLIISSLGYKTAHIEVKSLKSNFSNVSILLDPVVYSLKEVEIIGIPIGRYRLGNYEDTKKGYGGWLTGLKSQIAVFMDCKKYKNSKIVNASFFIAKNTGKPETPFRVRVYNVDSKSGNPGDDLIHDNIIVHGKRKGGWLTVDLSKYNLKAPSSGYFIAMEWIDSGEQYYYQTYINPLGKYVTNYGQSVSNSKTIKPNNTWLKFLGHDWIIHSEGEYHNSLIISEIEVLN